MPDAPKLLVYQGEFARLLGLFFITWSQVDELVDYAIGDFLAISSVQTHLLTSGTVFGRKVRLLEGLIARSKHPKKDVLRRNLNFFRDTAKRDLLSHSYIASTSTTVTFIHRQAS